MINLGYLLAFCGVIILLVKVLSDKTNDMINYLEPYVKIHDLKIKKTENYNSFTGPVSFPILDEDISASPAFAGLGAVAWKVYSVKKKVTLIDSNGEEYLAYASIDFPGYFSRELKRVRWKPELENLKK